MPSKRKITAGKRQRTAGKRQRRNSRKTRRIRRRGGAEDFMRTIKEADREDLVHQSDVYNIINDFKTDFPNEMKETQKNLVDFLNEELDNDNQPINQVLNDKNVRISTAIGTISKISDLKNKLAKDIRESDKEKLKKIFNNDNILKLCNLDKAIGQSFIDKGIVKTGMFGRYIIVK